MILRIFRKLCRIRKKNWNYLYNSVHGILITIHYCISFSIIISYFTVLRSIHKLHGRNFSTISSLQCHNHGWGNENISNVTHSSIYFPCNYFLWQECFMVPFISFYSIFYQFHSKYICCREPDGSPYFAICLQLSFNWICIGSGIWAVRKLISLESAFSMQGQIVCTQFYCVHWLISH